MSFFQQDFSMVPTVYNFVCCSETFFVVEWGLWPSHSPDLKRVIAMYGAF